MITRPGFLIVFLRSFAAQKLLLLLRMVLSFGLALLVLLIAIRKRDESIQKSNSSRNWSRLASTLARSARSGRSLVK